MNGNYEYEFVAKGSYYDAPMRIKVLVVRLNDDALEDFLAYDAYYHHREDFDTDEEFANYCRGVKEKRANWEHRIGKLLGLDVPRGFGVVQSADLFVFTTAEYEG